MGNCFASDTSNETTGLSSNLKPVTEVKPINAMATGKPIPWGEIKKHNTEKDCWIVVGGKVFDASNFLNSHPGGSRIILSNAGKDCTTDFEAFHSDSARKQLQTLFIGDLESADVPVAPAPPPAAATDGTVALTDPQQPVIITLQHKETLSHDTRLFRFALPNPQHRLGLPLGGHVFLSATVDGAPCSRAYTPTSRADAVGHFDLVIKVYTRNAHPRFPAGGKMSQHLDALALGDTIQIKGPHGHFKYTGRGRFEVDGAARTARALGFLCGGTGLTPAYQVIQAILDDREDPTECWLVYANQTPADILLREQLDRWAAEHPGRFRVHYTVSQLPAGAPWAFSTGYIDQAMVAKHIPPAGPDTFVGMCGPPPMIDGACIPSLRLCGHADANFMSF